jgi:N-acetylglucosamine kinase-like BadF-type ATPase
MKLIAESGSTKTEWSLIENGQQVEHVYTEGINPYFQTRREISRCIRLGLPEHFFHEKIDMIYYYGAGCSSQEKRNVLSGSLVTQFKTHTQVESDLLAAARGLFIDEKGIACILGTGSNSCFYNGEEITKNVRPGGFILGDEGSGAALGKIFLSDLLKNIAPSDLSSEFLMKFGISQSDILDSVYNHPLPNRFLDTVSYFLIDYIEEDYVKGIVSRNFRDFFTRCVSQYEGCKDFPVRFVGSMAINFKDVLVDIANEFGIEVSDIERSSMQGLIKYHSKREI